MPPTEESPQAFSTDPQLNDSINDVLSEFVDSPEPGAAPAPTQDDAGLGEALPSPAASSAGDQGHSAPASDRSTPAPDTAPPAPDPEYQPFTYPVNGEVRTMDGSYRIPGEGLFVPEANVPRWQQIAAQAETLERANKEVVDRAESLERLTSWQRVTGQDHAGKPIFETLTGRQGLEARTVATATFAAKAEMLDALLANPNKLAGLLAEERNEDGSLKSFQIHQEGLENFKIAMENAVIKAQGRARQHFATQSAPPPAAPAAEAPIAAVAMPTVEATIKQFNVTGLTGEDKQFLASQLERYVRPTTPEEQKAGYGSRVVDASFGALVQREGVRVKAASASAQAKAAADKFNTGQQRGRAGNRPAAPVAPIQTPVAEPKRKRGSRNERTSPSWDAVFERGFNDPDVQAALAGNG